MAKRRTIPKLSPEFLKAYQARLDAIGPWTIVVNAYDEGDLDVVWAAPPALANCGVPLALRFRTSAPKLPPAAGVNDPDDAMFGLYDLFVSRRDEFIAHVRAVAAKTGRSAGRIERVTVEVSRRGHPTPGVRGTLLRMLVEFADDDEHGYATVYDTKQDAFGALES